MSKLREEGSLPKKAANDESIASEPSAELKKGKKRKHKAKAATDDTREGIFLKKGTGKRTKFGDSDQEDEVPAKQEAQSVESTWKLSVQAPAEVKVSKIPSACDERPMAEVALQTPPTSAVSKPRGALNGKHDIPRPHKRAALQHDPAVNGKRQHEGRRNPQTSIPVHLLKKRDELLVSRRTLPIWPHAQSIRDALRKTNILVLTGETGSGKSTQVPQFLLDESWCTKAIAVTQPRRVAAISLARRVAEEMGSFFGGQSPAAKVGYSVRFDNASGPNTKIKFLTEGMLLQEMLRDPDMNQYSAVIVDEVHERSVNVDLILGFLKNLASGVERTGKKRRTPLKIVVMSATADVEGLVQFFGQDQDQSAVPPAEEGLLKANSLISICFVEGRQYPVRTTYLPEASMDWVESALKLIFQIHYKEPLPGDVLVFLTGQDKIESLQKLVNDYAEGMDKDVPRLLVLPLFAALSQPAQQLIFQPTPHRARKVILATNIAETSVTVPGVRFVIDCGKSKIKQFRSKLGLESLLAKPISKSAAIQRRGRAGREGPGQCYRLYTEADYKTFEERTIPEILRCDLMQALLTMKARGVNNVLGFPFLDRPPRDALEKALFQLLRLGALEKIGAISDIGLKIAKLPVTPTLGRILIEAAKPERDCLLDVIDIIAALSTEDNIFFNIVSEERKEEAEAARHELYRREGDHMTFLATVQRYAEENSDRKAWCERHFVSHRAMQNIMNIRKQLRQQCQSLKLLNSAEATTTSTTPNVDAILACLLRGFVSNTARLMPDNSYRTFIGNYTVSIHPSSVMHGRKVKAEAIVFSEFLYTNKAYAKKVSAVQMNWVEDVVKEVWNV
ncbi:P-loop containing nucleoside triphosphate hydrolase protein [Lentithecium fluviatile CBS 122367]|uniref:RNA helicase n=1 Tax=Lentithecium fluviatile CBS 122367 TaxID=1168545 RepID=A0A6G1J5N0_9PLEO|nr:P-loop containing nucleoside triphosphate hydrolase protein [Lentithecium fluviatile CBS 122367]